MERLTVTNGPSADCAYAPVHPDDFHLIERFSGNYGETLKSEAYITGRVVDKLAEYEDALEAGRIIMLPTSWKKMRDLQGDPIYVIWRDRVWDGIMTDVYISDDGEARIGFGLSENWASNCKIWDFDIRAEHYGEYVFRTREEAEAAFEKLKESSVEGNRDDL